MKTLGSADIHGVATAYANIITVTGDYTVQVVDCNSVLVVNSPTACTVTLPNDVSVGFQMTLMTDNDGLVTVMPPSGDTLHESNNQTILKGAYAVSYILKYKTTGWILQHTSRKEIDPYWRKVIFLLGDKMIDQSPVNMPLTAYGDTKLIQDAGFSGGHAVEFDGYSDYLVTPVSEKYYLGTQPFCAEAWFRPLGITQPYGRILCLGQGWHSEDCLLKYGYSEAKFTMAFRNGPKFYHASTQGIAGELYHLAIIRNGDDFMLFVNGVLEVSATHSGAIINTQTQIRVGGVNFNNDDYVHGRIQCRVTAGTTRYALGGFEPPSHFPIG